MPPPDHPWCCKWKIFILLWLSTILLHVYFYILPIHLLIDAYLGYCKECHYELWGALYLFKLMFLFSLDIYPRMELLNHIPSSPFLKVVGLKVIFSYWYPHSLFICIQRSKKITGVSRISYPTDIFIFYSYFSKFLYAQLILTYMVTFQNGTLQIPKTHTLLDPRVGHPDHAKQDWDEAQWIRTTRALRKGKFSTKTNSF